ncbi:MAG TPA: secretin N-terminal domain-containing protein [Candidatus Omnitrophota bacterium]|nr:secretin N-terminal domain-containing protein [Candidatus Omnitrophota bacterium]
MKCFSFTVAVCLLFVQPVLTMAQETQSPSASATTKIDILDIKSMDILDVLKLISQKSGKNIIASQNVKGRVSAYLKDIEAEEALKVIVESYGWAIAEEEWVIKVMTEQEYESRYGKKFGEEMTTQVVKLEYAKAAETVPLLNQMKGPSGKVIADDKSNTLMLKDTPAKVEEMQTMLKRLDTPVETKVFELSYAKAGEIAGKIKETVTPANGNIAFDERSNVLIVSAAPDKLKEAEALIRAFDKKDEVVQIDAKIVQVILSDEYKLGIDWEAMVREYHDLRLAGDLDILSGNEKKGTLSIGTLAEDNYSVLLQALQTIGTTNILSNPSITTLNNKEAKILVGSTEPYVTATTTTTAAGPTTTAESVNFIEVGVKLYVTPTIHRDGFITVKLKPEVSSVVRSVTTSNNNTIPVVETSQAETTVTVKDAMTIVIGGLIKEEDISTTKKIPVLGSIPVVGAAFRNQNDFTRKTEIVIFLTPKIISGDMNDI